jgi:hypothetical protein
MREHPLDRTDVEPDVLAADLSQALGREVAVATRPPGQTDDDGEPIPGLLVVIDPDSGDVLDVPPATVTDALTAHTPAEPVPPLTDDEITALRSMLATR